MAIVRNLETEKIYIEQLRNIKTAVWVLENKQREFANYIKKLQTPFSEPKQPEKKETDTIIITPILVVLIVFLLVDILIYRIIISNAPDPSKYSEMIYAIKCFKYKEALTDFYIYSGITIIIPIIFLLIVILNVVSESKQNQENYEKALKNNEIIREKNKQQYAKNLSEAEKYISQKNMIDRELAAARQRRDELLKINWIPQNPDYRDIRAIYYIYDMMTSLNISIAEAYGYYLQQETNNRLDKILSKMQEIINNQNKEIINQSIAQSQNAELIRKNQTMISKLSDIESNTQLAADYAQLASEYAGVNAFFGAASYLRNVR